MTRPLVVRAEHRATAAVWQREQSAFSGNDQRLRDERSDAPLTSGARNRQALERRMIADVVRRFAVCDLPEQLALVQIDGADTAVRRLDQREPLDRRRERGSLRVRR